MVIEAVTLAAGVGDFLLIGGIVLVSICALLLVGVLFVYGALWLQAYVSGADVSMLSLIGMSLRQVKASTIVHAKIMGTQAGLNIGRRGGMSTGRLEAHFLAGGERYAGAACDHRGATGRHRFGF